MSMRDLRLLAFLFALIASVCRLDFSRSPLPHLTSDLSIQDQVEQFPGDSLFGNAVSDGRGKITTGWGKRGQVLAAFGPPPAISFEQGREMWCYRLPPNANGQRLHLTVCFEGWLGMDELYGFTIGKSKWVIFDQPNLNSRPPADVWKF